MPADLSFEGDLGIAVAADTRAQWLDWLAGHPAPAEPATQPVRLELSAATSCDSAGVQLLLALGHSLAQRGQQLALHRPPECLNEVLGRFGLQGHWPVTLDEEPPQ